MPILYSVNIIFRKKVYLVNHRIRKFTDKYYSFLEGTLSEVIPIKIFCLESDMAQRYKKYLNEKLRLILKSVALSKGIGVIRDGFGDIINVIILLVAGISIIAGNMTICMLVSFSSYMEKFFEAISKLMELNLNKQEVIVCFERI